MVNRMTPSMERRRKRLMLEDLKYRLKKEKLRLSNRAFKSLKPPEFHKSADPVEARAWLKEMEKSFENLSTDGAQKTVFATYLLEGEANYWWDANKNMETDSIITWERFSQLFLGKYFSRFMENQMELKFLELKQNKLSISEYEAKFTELSRVAILELIDYATLVQKATIAEVRSEQMHKKIEKKGIKRKSTSIGRGEFDVILGMDWLSNNDAQIDCKGKKVKLNIPEKK
ncbi:hypothetical protein AgCh_005058 [Apium graveolens]